MHIALIFNRFRSDGGTERIALTTFRALADEDVECTVIAREWGGPAVDGVRFLRCKPFALGRTWRLCSFVRAVRGRLRRRRFDLVQSQVHMPGCDVYRADGGAHAEWLARRRLVQGPWRRRYGRVDPYHRMKLRMERRMYESPDLRAVICNSEMVRDDISRHYPWVSDKLHVIDNAIDDLYYRAPEDRRESRRRVREELGIASDSSVFVFVGSGFERKGVSVAIRALAGVDGAHLLVVGRDSRMRRYRALARKTGVAERVHFLGPQSDVRPYLWTAEALVHPALYEPFGLVVLEAMAAGLPVIASDRTGAALAMVKPEVTGYVLDPLDVAGYAGAMRRIAGGDASWRAAARQACEAAAAEYSLDRMRERLLALYRSLLNPAGRWS